MKEENELLRNGKVVDLVNPGTDGLKDYLIMMKAMSKMDPKLKGDDFMEYLDDKTIDSAINLTKLCGKKTYKDYSDEDDIWITENFMTILPKVIEMCSPKQNRNEDAKIKKLQEINENAQSIKSKE